MVIYETINTINGKRYIGKDKYNDPNYLGSGKLLNQAIKKYGRENFIKTILEYCNSEEHMCDRERHWIRITNAQTSDMYYNIGEGGNGGDNITNNPNRDEFIKKMFVINNDPKYKRTTTGHSDKTKQNQKQAARGRYTLDWFISKYGIEQGNLLYNERNQALSERYISKETLNQLNNIIESDLIELIKQGYSQEALKRHYGVTHKRLYKKYKQFFNTTSFSEIKKIALRKGVA